MPPDTIYAAATSLRCVRHAADAAADARCRHATPLRCAAVHRQPALAASRLFSVNAEQKKNIHTSSAEALAANVCCATFALFRCRLPFFCCFHAALRTSPPLLMPYACCRRFLPCHYADIFAAIESCHACHAFTRRYALLTPLRCRHAMLRATPPPLRRHAEMPELLLPLY